MPALHYKQLRGLPPVGTVATFADLPASVTRTTMYFVQADENNKNGAGVAQSSIYVLTGSAKLWTPASSIVKRLLLSQINLIGATQAETDNNTIKPLSGGGLELAGNTRLMTGGIGAGGNFDVKPDGNLYMQSNTNGNRSVFLHNEGISVNRGTNTARAGFDVGSSSYLGGDTTVAGNMVIPTANDRYFGFDGLSAGQTVRLRMGDPTGGLDVTSGAGMTAKAYHGVIVQNQNGGAGPALRVNGLSTGQNIFEFYDGASNLRAWLTQAGLLNVTAVKYPDGSIATSALSTAPTIVTISADQTALLNAIANQTVPTIITWTGVITLTQDIELRYKTGLELNCYGKGGLSRDNSPTMIVIRGDLKQCAIRGINFVNTSTGSNGSIILMNEQGPVDGLHIQHNTFVNTGTGNNAISSNSSGGANDQFITTHKNIYVEYNKFGGAVMPGGGISRMAVELKNHSADGAGPVQYCDRVFINYNEIWNTGTGDADGFGISLSGLFRFGTISNNVIVDAKKYSIEAVLVSDYVIEHNDVTDIVNTSNGVSISNGYKAAGSIPAGANRKVKVRRNTFNVKGRAILSYYVNNSEFTRNTCKSTLRSEWIGDENAITGNRIEVYGDIYAMRFEASSRNRIVDNTMQVYPASGVATSGVIYFDNNANNSYVRSNTLTRPTGSTGVHIMQASGVSNDIGTTSGSATSTNNTYVTDLGSPLTTSGASVQSGNGTTVAFTIAHGLGTTPGFVSVMAGSDAADQTNIKKATADATNITITFKVAPVSGTNNLTLYWEARR